MKEPGRRESSRETTCLLCGHAFDTGACAHVRWIKDGYTIVRCPSCSLLFRESLPTPDELARIYDEDYFRDVSGQGYLDYVADEDAHRATARARLALLDRYVAPSRLLDVGAAAGFFLDEAARHGWQATGIDVSRPMVEWGRTQLRVTIALGTLGSVSLEHGSLDAVTMWDYIEHSLDPRADLRRACELLRSGGILALSTGDASSWVARISGRRWHLLTPRHHNFYFTPRTLKLLLRQVGFNVLTIAHPGARYPVRYIVHKLKTFAPGRAVDRASQAIAKSRVGALTVPLNLGDIMTVVARKA